MKKTILSSFLLMAVLFSCKEKKREPTYYLKDKWTTKLLRYTVLKNSPRSVIEYTYKGIDSIEKEVMPVFSSYESYTYNEKGDQVEYKLFSGNEQYTTTSNYLADGYSVVMQDHTAGNPEEKLLTDFERIDTNEYRETEWLPGKGRKTQIVTYSNDGNKIQKEEVKIDSATGKQLTAKILSVAEYDDQRLLKQTWTTNTISVIVNSSKTFFYSPQKQLDSIVSDFAGNVTKNYFINNNMGDPLEAFSISNGDTTYHFFRTYKYDKKGNWVRMLQHRVPDKYWPLQGGIPEPPYILIPGKYFTWINCFIINLLKKYS